MVLLFNVCSWSFHYIVGVRCTALIVLLIGAITFCYSITIRVLGYLYKCACWLVLSMWRCLLHCCILLLFT